MSGRHGKTFIEALALAAPGVVLVAGALMRGWPEAASWVVLAASGAALLWRTQKRTPNLATLLPTICLAAVAVVGRLIFAAAPDVKPVSALVILAGVYLGRTSGLTCGALSALVSNLFLGQGTWTPWQMYVWALMGYGAGLLAQVIQRHRGALLVYGAAASMVYGWLMDAYFVVNFLPSASWQAYGASVIASLGFDAVHAAATVGFLLALRVPVERALKRAQGRIA